LQNPVKCDNIVNVDRVYKLKNKGEQKMKVYIVIAQGQIEGVYNTREKAEKVASEVTYRIEMEGGRGYARVEEHEIG
jgi:hypothetical protein